ncbi:site-specific integrase [Acinetobacter qingfengensis]|uniref:Integrase n=1 Tax=Acinetobacter qingfengensis TaxID=1262585 RepID=A0A1E7R935_9GAMM|nr:site-specific integrase [Acinetobacter qingfengensis]KAA8735721.1 site-specific integrase [Acinetobacter qingfengensis]OEY95801.1 integrase [Acinetobacter qingfengensis]
MKLPKPRKRGDAYRIEIMFDGKRYSCTRDTTKECEQWAAMKMLELKAGVAEEKAEQKPIITFKQLFEHYNVNVGRYKLSGKWIQEQFNAFDNKFGLLGEKNIYDITPKDLTDWRNKRSKQVSAGTVLKEMSLYSAIFTYAQKELFLIEYNPFSNVSKPKKPKARDRRISDDEIEILLNALDYRDGQIPTLSQHYVAWAFLFALETAMRRGEILGLMKVYVFEKHVHLPKTKNGEARDVPLTKKARALLTLIDHDNDKIIPQSENAFRLMFERTKAKVGLDDLHFHDTRHEAITRLVNKQKLPVEILAKMTGHKTIKMLVNTYYNPHVNDIADMLD